MKERTTVVVVKYKTCAALQPGQIMFQRKSKNNILHRHRTTSQSQSVSRWMEKRTNRRGSSTSAQISGRMQRKLKLITG